MKHEAELLGRLLDRLAVLEVGLDRLARVLEIVDALPVEFAVLELRPSEQQLY